MSNWSHQSHFVRFRLNVEQYGEIIAAQAFGGHKCGDEQPSYDIEVSKSVAEAQLAKHGLGAQALHDCLSSDETLRIEVKSKLARTKSGNATVIHCSDNKFYGVTRSGRQFQQMTHLLFIKVTPLTIAGEPCADAGRIESAWLMSHAQATALRTRGQSAEKHISVIDLENAGESGILLNLRDVLQTVASAPWSDV